MNSSDKNKYYPLPEKFVDHYIKVLGNEESKNFFFILLKASKKVY
jgi:hypothetical protein